MRVSIRHLAKLSSVLLILAGFSSQVAAQALFEDGFENRQADQAIIGDNWTWFDQTFGNNDCSGAPTGEFGPYSDGNGDDYQAANRNFFTAGGDGSYFRAGLEVPAWEGALTNMLRVYGNQYNPAQTCQRVLIFQELQIADAGDFVFSFDVAKDQYGAPANGEVIAAFVKVLNSSNQSYATLLFDTVVSTPPAATSPADVTTATQTIEFTIPEAWVGELLQFGFYNDITPGLGQSWQTSGAYYDNVELAEAAVVPIPPGPGSQGGIKGVPVPLWALLVMAGLLAYFGGSRLRSRFKA